MLMLMGEGNQNDRELCIEMMSNPEKGVRVRRWDR